MSQYRWLGLANAAELVILGAFVLDVIVEVTWGEPWLDVARVAVVVAAAGLTVLLLVVALGGGARQGLGGIGALVAAGAAVALTISVFSQADGRLFADVILAIAGVIGVLVAVVMGLLSASGARQD